MLLLRMTKLLITMGMLGAVLLFQHCPTQPDGTDRPDTTSHNFTWTIDTLGAYGSYLWDIAIIDENNIWVVGLIRTGEYDSTTGTEYTEYNAVRWDGKEWELLKIQPQGYVQPLQAIFVVNTKDIWFGRGSLPIHYNGEAYTMLTPAEDGYPGGAIINAIWGSGSDNVYFVGTGGNIVHYDGSGFTKMASGTEIRLVDVWGSADGQKVFATGYDNIGNNAGESVALEQIAGSWQTLYEGADLFSEPYGLIKSVTVFEQTAYIGCTEGVWRFSLSNMQHDLLTHADLGWDNSIHHIRGNASNDLFLISNWGMVNHYNGQHWRMDEELPTLISNDGTFYTRGVAVSSSMIGIAGLSNITSIGIVIRGKRTERK